MNLQWACPRWFLWGLFGLVISTVFTANVRRCAFIMDDAFISFRYSKHLVEGRGLVYNPGERVEGYTNFLWVLLIAGGMRVGVPPEVTASTLGILSGLGVLVGAGVLAARVAGKHPVILFAPLLLLAVNRTFAAWCTGGMETQLFSFLVLLAVIAYLRERSACSGHPLLSAFLLAAAALTRPEGLLFGAVMGVFFGLDVVLKRRSRGAFLAWCVPMVILIGGHSLWRHSYYGSWLPNTFHAKVAGAWFGQGVRYFKLFHEDYRLGWFLPLLPWALTGRDRYAAGLMLACVVSFCAYLLYIGGDAFEFRFLSVLLPFVYVLMIGTLAAWWRGVSARRWRGDFLLRAIVVGVFLALLATAHGGPVQPRPTVFRYGIQSVPMIKAYTEQRICQGKFLRDRIAEGALPNDVVFATGAAGAVPFYTDWFTIDIHGLTDPVLARMPIEKPTAIAHERRATLEYLESRGVEMYDWRIRFIRKLPRALTSGEEERVGGLYREIKLDGFYVGFVTFLDEEEFARRFGVRPRSR
jgi:arabinofuranosyltransferase